jgi:hypothetical protein
MKLVLSAGFGFALALSAFALSGSPAQAFEAPSVMAASPNGLVRVDDDWRERHEEREREERREREAREHREHCEHVRHECGERHGWERHEFHECVERQGCGR